MPGENDYYNDPYFDPTIEPTPIPQFGPPPGGPQVQVITDPGPPPSISNIPGGNVPLLPLPGGGGAPPLGGGGGFIPPPGGMPGVTAPIPLPPGLNVPPGPMWYPGQNLPPIVRTILGTNPYYNAVKAGVLAPQVLWRVGGSVGNLLKKLFPGGGAGKGGGGFGGGVAAGKGDGFGGGWYDPSYLRSIGYEPGQGTGSLWPGAGPSVGRFDVGAYGAGGGGGSFFHQLNPGSGPPTASGYVYPSHGATPIAGAFYNIGAGGPVHLAAPWQTFFGARNPSYLSYWAARGVGRKEAIARASGLTDAPIGIPTGGGRGVPMPKSFQEGGMVDPYDPQYPMPLRRDTPIEPPVQKPFYGGPAQSPVGVWPGGGGDYGNWAPPRANLPPGWTPGRGWYGPGYHGPATNWGPAGSITQTEPGGPATGVGSPAWMQTHPDYRPGVQVGSEQWMKWHPNYDPSNIPAVGSPGWIRTHPNYQPPASLPGLGTQPAGPRGDFGGPAPLKPPPGTRDNPIGLQSGGVIRFGPYAPSVGQRTPDLGGLGTDEYFAAQERRKKKKQKDEEEEAAPPLPNSLPTLPTPTDRSPITLIYNPYTGQYQRDPNVYPANFQGGGIAPLVPMMPPMAPGSTDTVPAMLTPGEMVLTRKQQGAVKAIPGKAKQLRQDQRAALKQHRSRGY